MDSAEILSICQVKYAYFRLLDTKRFTDLGKLLTEDATTAYQSGELRHSGRQAVVAFLQESLGDPGIVTMHNGHHPEIDLVDDGTAGGRWYLEDRVIVPAHDYEIHGTALYQDRYVKTDEGWKISHTGYDRIYEEHIRYSTGEVRSIRFGGQTTTF